MDTYEKVHDYLQKLHLGTIDRILDTYLDPTMANVSWRFLITSSQRR